MTVFRDLSQHILDIAENSVTANATLLHIDISESTPDNLLSFCIRDNGKGMDADTVRRITDPWVTSRTTRKVGLGIPFLKQTAEMCGGAFSIHSELGKGTSTRASFQHDHIDRPPLGDLVGTLLCIIIGYPQVDIIFQHVMNGEAFTLDTREIREVLGDDVPLSDPDIIAFIRGNLEEGLRAIKADVRD